MTPKEAPATIHHLVIPSWHPARLNTWDGRHWRVKHRLKKADREMVGLYARLAGIPPATGPRRVSLIITLAPRQRAGDVDAYHKSLLDALKHAGLILDDSRQWCEITPAEYHRGPARATAIVLEDLDGPGRRRRSARRRKPG